MAPENPTTAAAVIVIRRVTGTIIPRVDRMHVSKSVHTYHFAERGVGENGVKQPYLLGE